MEIKDVVNPDIPLEEVYNRRPIQEFLKVFLPAGEVLGPMPDINHRPNWVNPIWSAETMAARVPFQQPAPLQPVPGPQQPVQGQKKPVPAALKKVRQ